MLHLFRFTRYQYSETHDVSQNSALFPARRLLHLASLLCFAFASTVAQSEVVELHPTVVEKSGVIGVEYWSGKTLVACSTKAAPAGIELKFPDAEWEPVQFHARAERNGIIELGPEKVGAITLR